MTRVTLRGADEWHPERWTPPAPTCDQCRPGGYWSGASCDRLLTSMRMCADLYRCRNCGAYWRVAERQMVPIDGGYIDLMRTADAMPQAQFDARMAVPERPATIVGIAEGEWDRAADGRIILPAMPQQAFLDTRIREVWYVELLTVLADVLAQHGQTPSGTPYIFRWQSHREPINGMMLTRSGYGTALDVSLDTEWLRSQVRLDDPDLTFADDKRFTAAVGVSTRYHRQRGPLEVTTTAR